MAFLSMYSIQKYRKVSSKRTKFMPILGSHETKVFLHNVSQVKQSGVCIFDYIAYPFSLLAGFFIVFYRQKQYILLL